MESQPQNPEFRNNPEIFHPCMIPNATYQGPLSLPEEVLSFFSSIYGYGSHGILFEQTFVL